MPGLLLFGPSLAPATWLPGPGRRGQLRTVAAVGLLLLQFAATGSYGNGCHWCHGVTTQPGVTPTALGGGAYAWAS